MSSYEIDPAAVQGIVTAVQAEATQLSEGIDTQALETDVGGIANVPAPGVASAVAEFLQLEAPVIESIGNRITASMAGVAAVTRSYATASDEMLQNIQTRAIEASESGDFSYFGDA